jgi:tetratricopeptide (TPR) repeat protein
VVFVRAVVRVAISAVAVSLAAAVALGSLGGCGYIHTADTNQVGLFIKQGESALDRGDYVKAQEFFRRALELDPKSVVAQADLADVFIFQSKTAEGLKLARAAITLDPNNYRGYASLGSGLIADGQLDKAETALRKAIKLNPKDADSLGNLGVVFYKQGFMKLAAGYYQRAVALAPRKAVHWANLAAAEWWLGNSDETKSAAEKALAIDDANGQAHQYRAAVAIHEDDKDTAVEQARLAVKYAGQDAWSYALLSNAYANKLDWAAAADAANKALAIDPTIERALGILAFTKLKQGNYPDAVTWANKALEQDDADGDTYYTLGMAQHALGHLDAAIAAMSEAVTLEPTDAVNKRELAAFNKEKAKYAARIKQLEAQIAAAKKALAAQRVAAADKRAIADSSRLVNMALAYVRVAYSWRGATGELLTQTSRHAAVRVSAPGKGWTNIFLLRESNGMWAVSGIGG